MAGYNWKNGKSNNAVVAENNGLMVASKLAAIIKKHRRFSGCQARDIAAVMTPSEWHHSSKFFNEVNYYNPADLLYRDPRAELADQILLRKAIARFRKEAARRGITHLVLASGDLWYALDSPMNISDLTTYNRLYDQLNQGYCDGQSDGWPFRETVHETI